MRKFLFNSAMIGVIAGGWNTIQATRSGPRDWRLALLWAGWLLSVAAAVGTVIDESNERREDTEKKKPLKKK
jgi:anti-sigma factor RsiW